jgi:hypothetical protein
MTPEKYAQRLIAKYPDPLTIPAKDWWHEKISNIIRSATRFAKIEALEWAVEEFETALDGRKWTHDDVMRRVARIRAEIERRKG